MLLITLFTDLITIFYRFTYLCSQSWLIMQSIRNNYAANHNLIYNAADHNIVDKTNLRLLSCKFWWPDASCGLQGPSSHLSSAPVYQLSLSLFFPHPLHPQLLPFHLLLSQNPDPPAYHPCLSPSPHRLRKLFLSISLQIHSTCEQMAINVLVVIT